MKKFFIFCLIMFAVNFCFGSVNASFSDLTNPNRMVIGNGRIYVVQGFDTYIYSLKDYSLINKFGKQGEGPGEFVGGLNLALYNNRLYINSVGKLSIFDKNGILYKEIKSKDSTARIFSPLDGKFIGKGLEIDKERNRFRLLNVYSKDLLREKTLIREPYLSSFEKGVVKIFDTTFTFHVFGEKVYIVNGREFIIDVYDKFLKKVKTIKKEYKRVKFGEKDRQKVIDNLTSNPRLKAFAKEIFKRQRYPDYYPAILGLYNNSEYLFVRTYNLKGDKVEFMVYDQNGNFIKQLFIPLKMKYLYSAFPWSIKEDKLYQLIENEDEEWELNVNIINLK